MFYLHVRHKLFSLLSKIIQIQHSEEAKFESEYLLTMPLNKCGQIIQSHGLTFCELRKKHMAIALTFIYNYRLPYI